MANYDLNSDGDPVANYDLNSDGDPVANYDLNSAVDKDVSGPVCGELAITKSNTRRPYG